MIGFPVSPSRGDLTDMFSIKSSVWPPPWSLLIVAAIVGLIVWWYCKQHTTTYVSIYLVMYGRGCHEIVLSYEYLSLLSVY